MKKSFEFSTKDAVAMAQFVAELSRQKINYDVDNILGGWRIHIEGN